MPTKKHLLQAAGGGSQAIGFIATYSNITSFSSVAFDSNDNLYSLGEHTNMLVLSKHDKDTGDIVWTRKLVHTTTCNGRNIVVDSNDNIYFFGSLASPGRRLVVKYNSSGVLQWDKIFDYGSSDEYDNGKMVIDSNDNLFIAGQGYSTDYDPFFTKIDSSGTMQSFLFRVGSERDNYSSCAIDSNDNIYAGGYTRSLGSSNYNDALLAKYNTSGSLVSEIAFGKSSSSENSNEGSSPITVDSSGNIYSVGSWSGFGGSYFITKFNSSFTRVFSKTIGMGSVTVIYDMATDSNDDIYLVGYSNTTGYGSYDYIVMKFDSDGDLIWSNVLASSAGDYYGCIAFDSDNNVYIAGRTGVSDIEGFIAKLPSDGSGTSSTAYSGFNTPITYNSFSPGSQGTTNDVFQSSSPLSTSTVSKSTSDSSLTESAHNLTMAHREYLY